MAARSQPFNRTSTPAPWKAYIPTRAIPVWKRQTNPAKLAVVRRDHSARGGAGDEMKALMLGTLAAALGLTSGCFVSHKKEVYGNPSTTQADCERAGDKCKSADKRCNLD